MSPMIVNVWVKAQDIQSLTHGSGVVSFLLQNLDNEPGMIKIALDARHFKFSGWADANIERGGYVRNLRPEPLAALL